MKKFATLMLALVMLLSIGVSAQACTEWCGYIGPYFDTDIPTEDELQLEALQRINADGNKIIGKYANVVHYGNVRSEPNKYSFVVGKTHQNDEYLILDYQIVGNGAWLKVLYFNTPVWISASLAEISGKGAVDSNSPWASTYVGRTCRITVNSGRARMQADKDSPIIEYVGYNETYTILDVAGAPDSTLWFKIMKDGNLCWISSGIATTN